MSISHSPFAQFKQSCFQRALPAKNSGIMIRKDRERKNTGAEKVSISLSAVLFAVPRVVENRRISLVRRKNRQLVTGFCEEQYSGSFANNNTTYDDDWQKF